MSCNRTICSIWHECDNALGEELKPLCAEENFNSLQLLKAEISKVLSQAKGYHTYTGETGYQITNAQYEELLKLSAV